jgi:hypothetical protein
LDYYPSGGARAVIDALRTKRVGGDASSIINGIIIEWTAWAASGNSAQYARAGACEPTRLVSRLRHALGERTEAKSAPVKGD